jgi:serine/threonine-protein kinase
MPLSEGATFAGYTVVQRLGSGGMGEVYLVQHPRLPRKDALKILPPSLTADVEFRQRFIREADLAAKLFHPHIVGMHDRGEFDEQLWISMDYIDGTDAAQLVSDRYPAGMPVDEAVTITIAVGSALDHAHERGLLHRDVKPANILLTHPDASGQRRIFLADFGIARPLADPSGLTATNLTVGTVAYAAPEQLMGEDIDGRADEYALAATVFHLLTGAPPYHNSNPVAVISQHLNAPPPRLSSLRPDLARLDDVFSTALAKNPADRFGQCHEFATALSERAGFDDRLFIGRSGSAISAAAADTQIGITTPADNRPRWRSRVVFGAAALAVVLAVAGVVGYAIASNRSPNSPPAPTGAPPPKGPPAGPALEGVYRLNYDPSKRTTNGAATPGQPHPRDTSFWAFRSACGSAGCVATGVGMDYDNPDVARTPAISTVLGFVDGHWQDAPQHRQVNQPSCLAADGSVGPGSYTEAIGWSMQPQADGMLRGVATTTVVTNECGGRGVVVEVPFVANRVGDVPSGVAVADPTTVMAPVLTKPTTPGPGPGLLEGVYRIDLDFQSQTVDGAPAIRPLPNRSEWWAFRSACDATGCVAAGAQLVAGNLQQPTGVVFAFDFTEGRWQDTPPTLQSPEQCSNGPDSDVSTVSWSLVPQQDGTLRGVGTRTILTDQCGLKETVYKVPLVGARTGDVPANVVIADPTLLRTP